MVRGPAAALIRPEKIAFGPGAGDNRNALAGRIEDTVFLGTVIYYVVGTAAGRVIVLTQNTGAARHETGTDVTLSWEAAHTLLVPRGAHA